MSDLNPLKLEFTENFGQNYWLFNCPLQMWAMREHIDENSKILYWRVINYMPRKETCRDLEEVITHEELPTYCRNAAKVLRNLADLFDALANRKIDMIYYPDEQLKGGQSGIKK